jgi:hypothetical protein
VLRLRKGVESILRAKHGQIGIIQAARVQSLCRIELSARIAEQSIRDDPKLTADELRVQRLAIGQWTRERDGLLAKLVGEDVGTAAADPASLYAMPAGVGGLDESEHQLPPESPSESLTENLAGNGEPPAGMEVSFGNGGE